MLDHLVGGPIEADHRILLTSVMAVSRSAPSTAWNRVISPRRSPTKPQPRCSGTTPRYPTLRWCGCGGRDGQAHMAPVGRARQPPPRPLAGTRPTELDLGHAWSSGSIATSRRNRIRGVCESARRRVPPARSRVPFRMLHAPAPSARWQALPDHVARMHVNAVQDQGSIAVLAAPLHGPPGLPSGSRWSARSATPRVSTCMSCYPTSSARSTGAVDELLDALISVIESAPG